jgi:hypothetical protein
MNVNKSLMLALIGLVGAVASNASAERTFYWSMESDTADVYPAGSDGTAGYYPVPIRSTAMPRTGAWSLDLNGGPWRESFFDNPTNNDVWCSTEQGAVEFYWMTTGGLTGGEMLMQITGKCKTVPALDTNDGVSIRFHGDTEMDFGYGWDGENWGGISVRHHNWAPYQTNHWYKITARWNATTAPHLSLQIDDGEPILGTTAPQPMLAETFHQVLIGNDRNTSPLGLYIDDFTIYNDFAMTGRPLAGDADGDGDVDLDDFVILKSSFGADPLTDGRADFDDDGDVDLDDFVILKNNFGADR